MASKKDETKATETKTQDDAAKAAAKEAAEAAKAEATAVRQAQGLARVVLGEGVSDIAKAGRRFVAASGKDAPERTARLVKDILALIESSR